MDKARRTGPQTGPGAAARRIQHSAGRAGWWMRFAYPRRSIIYLAQFNAIITFGTDDDNEMLRALRRIQDNYETGVYRSVWDGDILEVRANLPQARLVVPLNIQVETEKQNALA